MSVPDPSLINYANRASRYAAGPVFYQAFETNAVEPPLTLLRVRKPETGYAVFSPYFQQAMACQGQLNAH